MTKYSIRAHHGMCLAFFRGEGYDSRFVKHMISIKENLRENPKICVINKTDEICAFCPNNSNGLCVSAQKVSGYDKKVLELCGLEEGTELDFKTFESLVEKEILHAGRRTEVCGDCEWNSICNCQTPEDCLIESVST